MENFQTMWNLSVWKLHLEMHCLEFECMYVHFFFVLGSCLQMIH